METISNTIKKQATQGRLRIANLNKHAGVVVTLYPEAEAMERLGSVSWLTSFGG